MSILDNLNVTTLDPARYPEVRAALVAEADALVTRSGRDGLDGADADAFRRIEQVVGNIDFMAGANQWIDDQARALDRFGLGNSGPAGPGDDGSRPAPRTAGARNRVERIRFDESTVEAAFDALQRRQSATIESRAVTGLPMAARPTYVDPPNPFGREPTRVATHIPMTAVTTGNVTHYRQTAGTSAAATVAEGAAKPESGATWEAVALTVRKIAHYIDVSTEALADYQAFQGIVTAEMVNGVIATENAQILTGDGLGTNLEGLLTTSGIQTYAPAAAEDHYRSIRHAMTMLRTGDAYIEPDAIIMHPSDVEAFDLSNTSSEGVRSVQSLTEAGARTAWGATIIPTTGVTAGTAIVANLATAATIYMRQTPVVMVDPYSQSANNLVRFIAEERLALGVRSPEAIVEVTFNTGP